MLVELSENKKKFISGLEFYRKEYITGLKSMNKKKLIDELKYYRREYISGVFRGKNILLD